MSAVKLRPARVPPAAVYGVTRVPSDTGWVRSTQILPPHTRTGWFTSDRVEGPESTRPSMSKLES